MLSTGGNIPTEVIGKEKVLLQKQHIRFNVEKTEGNAAVIYALKRQWHVFSWMRNSAADRKDLIGTRLFS
jgi:hypothetical protein